MKYKVGDRVRIKNLDWYDRHTSGTEVDCGGVPFTSGMKKFCNRVMTISCVHADCYTMVEDLENYYTDEMIEGLAEDKEYPKTYSECCKVMNYCCNPVATKTTHREELIRRFQFLLMYRDTYWKIAGEEMRLGKPWEPENPTKHYIFTIENCSGDIIKNAVTSKWRNRIFVFPTAEMRDAFFENFNKDIEICKEFL